MAVYIFGGKEVNESLRRKFCRPVGEVTLMVEARAGGGEID
jgi:hypothetical protein